MAHSLINSAPLIAGMTTPEARRELARYVCRLSRGLIGKKVAESLMYPRYSSFGAVSWLKTQQRFGHILLKTQQRFGHILDKISPGHRQNNNFTNFTSLLDTSLFDEEGIRYTLPDHVYAEESSSW